MTGKFYLDIPIYHPREQNDFVYHLYTYIILNLVLVFGGL